MTNMDPDNPHAMPHDYWQNAESYAESSEPEPDLPEPAPGVEYDDLDESVEEHVRNRTDDMWDIHAITLADTGDDGKMYLLVIRSGVGDSGDKLLEERYFTTNPREPYAEGTGYSTNGITRNVSGDGLLLALKVAYAATSDGLADGHSLTMECQNGQLLHNSDALTDTFADIMGVEAPEPSEPSEPSEPEGKIECVRCSRMMDPDKDDVVVIPGDLGEMWIHDTETGGCPEGGETDG